MRASEGLEASPEMSQADSGAHQPSDSETSDSEDQFTDARSGPATPRFASPIPKTRVERVESGLSYGEVPGTEAHHTRAADAQPDEVVFADDLDSHSTPDQTPRHEVQITVFEPEQSTDTQSGDPESLSGPEAQPDAISDPGDVVDDDAETMADEGKDDDFADDFDDFEEGGHDEGFEDFEDDFQQPQPQAASSQGPPPFEPLTLPFSIPDFDGLGPDEVLSASESCLDSLFPPLDELGSPPPRTLPKESAIFLTPRSASLWSQLVAPPPLAPPDWIRSRTRRLFLVSLGVPVDLDEILPASKQKKLVLPSLSVRATSPRTSSDSRSASRVRQGDGNASSTSVDTQGKPSGSRKKKGPPPEPELDLVAARYLCTTTDEALDGMTDAELQDHVSKLEAMQGKAEEVLGYWQKRTDEKIGDREAFEGVIENLVKHARKVRN